MSAPLCSHLVVLLEKNTQQNGHTDCFQTYLKNIHRASFTLYSKSEKSRPPRPPLNPGGPPLVVPKEPLLSGRPLPPRGAMNPRPRKPPRPLLCLRGMPNVSEFMRLSSAQVDLRSLTHNDHHGVITKFQRKPVLIHKPMGKCHEKEKYALP